MRDFVRGLTAPFRGARLIVASPPLRRLAVMPVLINIVVFIAGITLAAIAALSWVRHLVPGNDLLRIAVQILAVAAVLVAALFLFLIVGNIIAGPFNSRLSQAIELQLTGRAGAFATTVRQDVGRSIATTAGRLFLFIVCYPPILLTALIPVIGFIVQPLLATLYLAFVLSLDFSDFVFERHMARFGEKVRYIRDRRALYLGLG
ncbi:MAG: EI24 domain-containing protein [Bacteroidetes bacterium]|nr:EI24 domain-containing protein [Bacteroidota bacterium]